MKGCGVAMQGTRMGTPGVLYLSTSGKCNWGAQLRIEVATHVRRLVKRGLVRQAEDRFRSAHILDVNDGFAVHIVALAELQDSHVRSEQVAAESNADSCLNLVPWEKTHAQRTW